MAELHPIKIPCSNPPCYAEKNVCLWATVKMSTSYVFVKQHLFLSESEVGTDVEQYGPAVVCVCVLSLHLYLSVLHSPLSD